MHIGDTFYYARKGSEWLRLAEFDRDTTAPRANRVPAGEVAVHRNTNWNREVTVIGAPDDVRAFRGWQEPGVGSGRRSEQEEPVAVRYSPEIAAIRKAYGDDGDIVVDPDGACVFETGGQRIVIGTSRADAAARCRTGDALIVRRAIEEARAARRGPA